MYVCMYVSAFCRGMRVECDDMCVRVGGGGGRRQEAGGRRREAAERRAGRRRTRYLGAQYAY